jgi:hypothetical protein
VADNGYRGIGINLLILFVRGNSLSDVGRNQLKEPAKSEHVAKISRPGFAAQSCSKSTWTFSVLQNKPSRRFEQQYGRIVGHIKTELGIQADQPRTNRLGREQETCGSAK